MLILDTIFRMITGNGLSSSLAWKDGTGSTTDEKCRAISNTSCAGHYRDPRIGQWGSLNVRKVCLTSPVYPYHVTLTSIFSKFINCSDIHNKIWSNKVIDIKNSSRKLDSLESRSGSNECKARVWSTRNESESRFLEPITIAMTLLSYTL